MSSQDPNIRFTYEKENDNVLTFLDVPGADVNCPNDTETTALFCAAFGNHSRVVEFLLKNGADPNLPNCGNWTPLDQANGSGHKECAEFIKEFGGKSNVNHTFK